MADIDVLNKAHSEDWILITSDKDFGEKVYREKQPHHGVIFFAFKMNERRQKSTRLINSVVPNSVILP